MPRSSGSSGFSRGDRQDASVRKERAPPEAPVSVAGLLVGAAPARRLERGVRPTRAGSRTGSSTVPVRRIAAYSKPEAPGRIGTSGARRIVATGNPEALIGHGRSLLKLAATAAAKFRLTAFWALGRTTTCAWSPPWLLSERLGSRLHGEAATALRYITRTHVREPPTRCSTSRSRLARSPCGRSAIITVRPYDDRDDSCASAGHSNSVRAPRPGLEMTSKVFVPWQLAPLLPISGARPAGR